MLSSLLCKELKSLLTDGDVCIHSLTLSQMTNFGLFQTESICKQQFKSR